MTSLAAPAKLARPIFLIFLLAAPCFTGSKASSQNFCLAFTLPQATTFTIVGLVRNRNGQTVTDVRVLIIDENFQTIHNSFIGPGGYFRVEKVKQGRYTIRVETTGTPYEEQSQSIELQALRKMGGGNETWPVEFILKYKKGEGLPTNNSPVFAQDIPKAARTEYERGTGNLKSSKTDQGITSLKKAVEIFPDYFDALELLGTEYVKNGQYEAAIPVLNHATEINKRAPKSLYALGVAYLKLSRLPEAIESLEKSAQIDGSSANTQMMLGLAYGNNGALDKSEAGFKKALQLGGSAAAEAHYYLTGLYNKLERYHEAWQELELFLKEAKNVKDPTQIKAMIANLKEKEKAQIAQPATLAGPTVTTDNPPAPTTSIINASGNGGAVAHEAIEPAVNRTTADEANPVAATLAPVPPLTPEYIELLHQTEANGTVLHKRMLDYTYKLKKTHRVLNASGNSTYTQEQVFEAYPIHGEHVLITLSKNGIPSRTVADERKRAAKQLEEAEQQRASGKAVEKTADNEADGYVSAGVTGVYSGKTGYVSINVAMILRSCEFFSPRTEKIGDREMVVLNYRYRVGTKLAANHSYIAGLVGTVWIDSSDKVLTRLEGWPNSAAAFDLVQSTAPRDEAALIYQQVRQPDGTWVPSLIRMNAGGRVDLFDGLNWDVVFEFGNYQQFNTKADEVKIKSPVKTP